MKKILFILLINLLILSFASAAISVAPSSYNQIAYSDNFFNDKLIYECIVHSTMFIINTIFFLFLFKYIVEKRKKIITYKRAFAYSLFFTLIYYLSALYIEANIPYPFNIIVEEFGFGMIVGNLFGGIALYILGNKICKDRITYFKNVFVAVLLSIIVSFLITSPVNNIIGFIGAPSGGLKPVIMGKPVIYLYPVHESTVNVELDFKGELIADYPEYDESINGWNVNAKPNGELVDLRDNKEYSYIFWEGIPEEEINWDLSKGFVVAGEDSREFLQEILPKMGLTPKEYNEFIVYWYPLMMNNKYNLIHFAEEQYTENAPLTITPTPDSVLRVFMVIKPLEEKIDIIEQEIKIFKREGFSVIEWGGTILK